MCARLAPSSAPTSALSSFSSTSAVAVGIACRRCYVLPRAAAMTDVTKDGLVGERPGREAMIGAHGTTQRLRPGRHRRRRGGEELMVPPAEPVSYYGRPVLNRPVWSARDI